MILMKNRICRTSIKTMINDTNMNAEQILNNLIVKYRSLKTEEKKKGFDRKMLYTLPEVFPEERK